MAAASTSSPAHSACKRGQLSGGTASTMRSCDSEIQISVYDSPAVDERVAEVALVEADGPVDGRDAHAVAVVAHAGHDALEHLQRVQHAGRQRLRRRVRRGEAEDVGVADRPGPQPGAERVAD